MNPEATIDPTARIRELEKELAAFRAAEAGCVPSEDTCRQVLEASPYCIKLLNLQGQLISMNRAGLDMLGEKNEEDIVGRDYMNVVSPQDLPRVQGHLQRALVGEFSEFEFTTCFGPIFRSNFAPVFGEDGTITSLISITQDVTEQRRLQDSQQLLMNELDHRVKNNMTVVLGLAEQTRAASTTLDEFVDTFSGRIRALAHSHDQLATHRWAGVPARNLVEKVVETHWERTVDRIIITGDSPLLTPEASGPLSLSLHELFTNALKYGAMSTPAGRIEINITETHDSISLTWSEFGTACTETPVPGVGLTLVRGLIEHQLGGSVEFNFEGPGCVIKMDFPLHTPKGSE